MTISVALSDGVKQIVYDAAGRTALVYYKDGSVEYFLGVAWGDFSAVASSAVPSVAVQTNFVAKYRSSKGGHG